MGMSIIELWYTEKQTHHVGITCQVKETIFSKMTAFQELAILDTFQFGKMLVLDGMVQLTLADEFIYHEMITHVPLNTHRNPQKVLVIGGGDGGTVREIIKHPEVARVVLVEIDEEVVKASKKYLPQLSCGLEDKCVEIMVRDGIEYVKAQREEYDVIIVDSTEPVGPAVGLFAQEFYDDIFRALKSDGIMVAQTESPFFNQDLIRSVYKRIRSVFPITRLYLASIPTYPSGLWSFTMGSKFYDPLKLGSSKELDTKYYTSQIHKSCFILPKFIKELLEAREVGL